jgi:hypothetical protein
MPNFATISGNTLTDSGISAVLSTSGTSGIKNNSGTSGTNGLSGTSAAGGSGNNGTSGTSGASSNNGANGTRGTSGTSGSSGLSRTSGTKGNNGTSGTNGASIAGNNGANGTSGAIGYIYTGDGNNPILSVSGTSGYFAQGGTSYNGPVSSPSPRLSTNGTFTTFQPEYYNSTTPTPTYTHTFRVNRGEFSSLYQPDVVFNFYARYFTNTYGYNNPASGGNERQLIHSNGTFGVNYSTRKGKNNINYLTDVSWLNDLEPVSYNFRKTDKDGNPTEEFYEEVQYGLIAEDVEKINPNLVVYKTKGVSGTSGTSGATGSSGTSGKDEEKIITSVHYNDLLSPMTLKLQQLDERMKILESK